MVDCECGGAGCHCDRYDKEPCVLCGRRRPIPDRVDAKCREWVLGWIADLPSLLRRLGDSIVPGQAVGERVRSSSPSSRTPANNSAISLSGISGRMAQPDWRRPDGWTPEDAGRSIPEWVDGWVRAWRQRHEHHRPTLVNARPVALPERPGAPTRPRVQLRYDEYGELLGGDEIRADLERWRVELVEWQQRREAATVEGGRVVLGVGAALAFTDRPDDPIVERLGHRFGQRPEAFAVGAGAGYLAAWFEYACDHPVVHPDLPGFITELRALVNSARAVLGERRDDEELGRCPVVRRFRDEAGENREEYCGTVLRQDAFASRVVCRRCRTEWSRDQLLRLAMLMHEAFPEDFRRETWEAAR